MEFLLLTKVLDSDERLLTWARFNLEWPELDITLDGLVTEFSADKTLGIEDSVDWVSCDLRFGSVTDETLFLSEGDVGWGGVDTLIVGNDFNLVVLPDTYA